MASIPPPPPQGLEQVKDDIHIHSSFEIKQLTALEILQGNSNKKPTHKKKKKADLDPFRFLVQEQDEVVDHHEPKGGAIPLKLPKSKKKEPTQTKEAIVQQPLQDNPNVPQPNVTQSQEPIAARTVEHTQQKLPQQKQPKQPKQPQQPKPQPQQKQKQPAIQLQLHQLIPGIAPPQLHVRGEDAFLV
eukprot:TRINITY_DN9346_c0_g1_i1.p1 TRINITY_DN9346_c0_g1~~TRINITY_DN9346_c0_g1_i1.p1  ORF type:complete len:187 (-),score=57.53 TRINITY_DN9346_c0_g1_i1:120-680(-)